MVTHILSKNFVVNTIISTRLIIIRTYTLKNINIKPQFTRLMKKN